MFRGSFVALVTPMTSDGSVDQASFRQLIQFHIEKGTQGLIINGTTGESATLSAEEKLVNLQIALDETKGQLPIIAGTGTNSTQTTIEQTKEAAKLGVAACLVVTPYYNRPTQYGLYRHYQQVALHAPVPILLYNVPKRTGCDLLPETTIALANDCPNIIGLKEAADWQRIEILRAALPTRFSLLSGDDPSAYDFMCKGGDGVISVTANIVPTLMRELCDHTLSGALTQAQICQNNLLALHQALGCEPNPIPVKWLMHQTGLIPEGLRLPLTPLSEEHHAKLNTIYETCLRDYQPVGQAETNAV